MMKPGRSRIRDRCWPVALASLMVAALMLAAPGSAKADGPGCTPADFSQAAQDAWNEAPPASCQLNDDDPVYWALYGFIGAGAAGAQPGGPNPMKDACAAVKTAQATADKLTGPLNDLWGVLGADNQAALEANPLFSGIKSNATDLLSLAPIIICACDMVFDHGLKELTDDAGVCVLDALCAGFSLFGEIPCDCQNNGASHITKVIDCTNAELPDGFYNKVNEANAVPTGPAYSTTCDNNGICATTQNPATLSGCNATVTLICQCPAPMVIQGIVDSASGPNQYYAECTCPNGTTPGPFAGSKVCLCANGLAMNANGTCPTPKPIPPPKPPKPAPPPACTIAGTVRLADNSCCAPTQVTSCGVCCPAGQKPDSTGASCISAQPVKYLPPFKPSPKFTPGLPAKP
jgi:hypothetical protein